MPPGMEKHPEALYPLSKGCQVARATDLFRIGTHHPSRPFAMLSPSVTGPLVHYAARIGSGTCRVNGTVVLDDMGLAGSLFISAEKQKRVR